MSKDRIRPILQAISTAFPHKDTQDALAALAELERERDRHAEVREIITSVVCGALNRAGINEVDNPGVAIDAIRNRAENAERERDELRAKLAEYEQAPTVATVAWLRQRIASIEAEKAERERQEPVAWAWNDALGCMHAHCGSRRPVWVDGECSDAKRAETSLRPLYAHPLALREPTDEECKRIAALWNIQGDYNATDLGRAMVRAVKEVLK